MLGFKKCEGKKIERKSESKKKKRLKNNKLFLYVILNSFNLIFSIILILNNYKIHKFISNFNDI